MSVLIAVEESEWAAELETMIHSFGFQSTRRIDSLGVLKTIKARSVELIICETVVNQEDAIGALQQLPDVQCPIIFITDTPTESAYTQTTQFKQARFLVKPFHQLTLRSIVDALFNGPKAALAAKGVKVRSFSGQRLVLAFDKILWISADKNYCLFHTRQGQYMVKQSLIKLSQQLDARFIQVHKGFWVNMNHITRANLGRRQVFINDNAIPVGKTYKDQLADRLLESQDIKL